MAKFIITETAEYEIHDKTAEDAERLFLAEGPSGPFPCTIVTREIAAQPCDRDECDECLESEVRS